MSELPEGWAISILGEICSKPQYGWTSKSSKTGQIKYVRTTDISDGGINWDDVPYCDEVPEEILKYQVKSNDILVSRAGSVGVSYRVTDVPCKAVFASYLIRFNPLDGILPEYVSYYLKSDSYWRAISELSAGIAVPNVNASKLAQLEIPLPPFNEQRRIVAKLETLLDKVDACQQRLAKFSRLLKRFRQAVLAAACSGRLTADWREWNSNIESASLLLDNLFEERFDKWEAGGRRGKYREPDPVTDEDLPSIPESWCWTNFDHCASEITVGHVGPMKDRYVEEGIPFLRSQNVRPLRYDPKGLVYIPRDFHRTLVKSKLVGGEILVVRSGANTGDCCVFPMGQPETNCADLVITRPLSGLCPDYAAIYVSSPIGQARLSLNETGIAQPHFNIGAMRKKAFPLPPLAEQQKIVRRVEAFFRLADQLESHYQKAHTHVGKLAQSILAKAFRGELVPQDPNDEPAAVMLERIRAERAPRPASTANPAKRAVKTRE